MSNNPFKFLDSYTKEDKNIFFGREHETEELYQKIFESKILLVYGVTGTGKTSLINCGLANKFNDSDWLPIYVRRNQDIVQSIIDQLTKFSYDKKKVGTDKKSILKLIQSVYLDNFKPIYLLFDQFEELFIFGNKDERKAFVELVDAINKSDIQCKCLFILREEFLANITEFERTIPEFFLNRIRIEKMSPTKAIETIKGPCIAVGIEIQDEAAENILHKVSKDKSNVELTYLQVLLDKVYQTAKEESKDGISITQSIVNKIGDVEDILGDFLEQQIKTFDNSDDVLNILKSFVSVQGTKKQVNPDEIVDYLKSFGHVINLQELSVILQQLVAKRILKEKDDCGRYELIHDALAAKIFEKFTLVEKELLDVKKYVENAFYNFEKRGILFNKQDFEYLDTYKNKLILPQNLNDFVNQSRLKLDSQQKSFVRITRISALILLLIVAAIGRTLMLDKKQSEIKKDIGSILLLSETNPIKGIYKAIELWEKDSTSNVLNYMILNSFQKLVSSQVDSLNPIFNIQKDLEPLKLESNILEARISEDGEYIYGWMDNQKVFIVNIYTNKLNYFETDGQLENVEFSKRDSSIALIYRNNSGKVCDFNGTIRYSFRTTLNEVMNERLVRFFPSGDYHLIVANNKSALIYDNKGKIVFDLKGHMDRINSIDISPDGRFIATASNDRKVFLWNYNKISKQMSVYDSLIGHYDNVWSCEFNKTGKYILTTSADSMIKLWRFDGTQVNPQFNFARNYGDRYKYNNREEDDDVYNPDVSTYYRKMCNATFSKNEREIIATGYEFDTTNLSKKRILYNQVLFLDERSVLRRRSLWDFLEFSNQEYYSVSPERYNEICLSPKGHNAIVVTESNENKLVSAGGLHVISIEGNNPMYSMDGEMIFWTNGNEIHRIPINPMTLKDLIEKYKLQENEETVNGNIVVI